jgi:uncharacterized membrane protein required for colicin V production
MKYVMCKHGLAFIKPKRVLQVNKLPITVVKVVDLLNFYNIVLHNMQNLKMQYTYFPKEFFVVLDTKLSFMFIHCKPTIVLSEIIFHCILLNIRCT